MSASPGSWGYYLYHASGKRKGGKSKLRHRKRVPAGVRHPQRQNTETSSWMPGPWGLVLRTRASVLAGATQPSEMQFGVFCALQTGTQREKQRIAFAAVSREGKGLSIRFEAVSFSISVFYEVRPDKYFPAPQNQNIFCCLGLYKAVKP